MLRLCESYPLRRRLLTRTQMAELDARIKNPEALIELARAWVHEIFATNPGGGRDPTAPPRTPRQLGLLELLVREIYDLRALVRGWPLVRMGHACDTTGSGTDDDEVALGRRSSRRKSGARRRSRSPESPKARKRKSSSPDGARKARRGRRGSAGANSIGRRGDASADAADYTGRLAKLLQVVGPSHKKQW